MLAEGMEERGEAGVTLLYGLGRNMIIQRIALVLWC